MYVCLSRNLRDNRDKIGIKQNIYNGDFSVSNEICRQEREGELPLLLPPSYNPAPPPPSYNPVYNLHIGALQCGSLALGFGSECTVIALCVKDVHLSVL